MPDVPTQCKVSVQSASVGARVVLNVVVSASSNTEPTGRVQVRVSKTDASPWTTTVRYEGSPLRIVGPRLERGDHTASIRFIPDEGVFLGCKDSVQVGAQADVGDEGPGTPLPDTGGPPMLLLFVGAGLVTTGGGLVGGSRRSRA